MGASYSRAKYDKTSFWKDYLANHIPHDAAAGKTVAVTGATANGLGIWLAKHAALLGAKRVVLLNRASPRSAAAEEEVRAFARDHGSATEIATVECDLLSFASVSRGAAELTKLCAKHDDGCLDVLCLNAGTMAAPDEVTEDGYNREAQVNVLAQALLLKETFPLLARAAATRGEARVVQHSSGARMIPKRGELVEAFFSKTSSAKPLPAPFAGDAFGSGMFAGGPAWQRYGQTKLANAMLSELFRERLAGKSSKVKALVASPGLAATELQVTTGETFRNMKAWETNLIFKLAGQGARDGSLPLTRACFHPDAASGDFYEPKHVTAYGPPVAIASGGTFKNPKAEKAVISDPETKDMMWRVLAEACGGEIF
jgi:NAD(P)-dependent dehydrogenase (short-subunit alcohol dehydrogenase family)